MEVVRGYEGVMSKVISFRLNPDNPREAQALEILRTKQAEGFSSRRVLTDALIGLMFKNDVGPPYSLRRIQHSHGTSLRVVGLHNHWKTETENAYTIRCYCAE